MSSKKLLILAALISAFVVAHPALAQNSAGGCGDSPENPTVILAGLASGAYAISAVRTRFRARKARPSQQ